MGKSKKVNVTNNILPNETNNKLLYELSNHHWFIAYDNQDNRLGKLFSPIHSGLSIITFNNGINQFQSPLNIYGQIIFDIIKDKLKINCKLERLMWNMYFKNDEGEIHIDQDSKDHMSALYSIHTTDGGIEIENMLYPDVMGQAKVFNSNIKHKGVGPKKENIRFNLNILFKI